MTAAFEPQDRRKQDKLGQKRYLSRDTIATRGQKKFSVAIDNRWAYSDAARAACGRRWSSFLCGTHEAPAPPYSVTKISSGPRLLGELGDVVGQARNLAACGVLVNDALLCRAHDHRLRLFQGRERAG